tara:strand:+ start:154 stop:759 length:606 start_codon:yes stop_codon:yes gene_type:complete
MRRSYHSNTAFLDLLFNTLLGFVAFFAITLIHVKKESTDSNLSDIDLDSHVMIIASWPEHHFDDIDMYVRDPKGGVVFFRNKDNDIMHLDRDDLGNESDYYLRDTDETREFGTNREIVTIRKKFPGEFIVNLHAYSKRNVDPVPVEVKVYQVKTGKLVHENLVFIEHRGQELTAVRLTVKESGATSVSDPFFFPIARDIVR